MVVWLHRGKSKAILIKICMNIRKFLVEEDRRRRGRGSGRINRGEQHGTAPSSACLMYVQSWQVRPS